MTLHVLVRSLLDVRKGDTAGDQHLSRTFNTLQVGRASAALSVLLFHIEVSLGFSKYTGHDMVPANSRLFRRSVLFYLLSSFPGSVHAGKSFSNNEPQNQTARFRGFFLIAFAALTFHAIIEKLAVRFVSRLPPILNRQRAVSTTV